MARPEEYGDTWADVYDEFMADRGSALDPGPAVAFLAAQAGDGAVLELGVGTGRVAVPLAALGIEVHGIEASSRMVDRLRARPGGHRVNVTIGDVCHFEVASRFRVVCLVYNMLFHLPDQECQVSCLASSARALEPLGRLVIESMVPDLSDFRDGKATRVARLGPSEVEFRISEHLPVEQKIVSQHVWLEDGRIRMRPVVVRYVWPAETDLMAPGRASARGPLRRLRGEPFGPGSRVCVSVYRKPE